MPTIDELTEVKNYSDVGRYELKGQELFKWMSDAPDEWVIDQQDPRTPGITHIPTGFQYHIPWKYIPTEVGVNSLGENVVRDSQTANEVDKEATVADAIEEDQELERKLYYFEGRNTGIVATSEEEARAKKKRGGDKLMGVRSMTEQERKDDAADRWIRTRIDGLPPSKSEYGQGRGFGPPRKEAMAPAPAPGIALQQALANLDLDELEAQHRAIVKKGPKSKRENSIKVLGILDGLKRNEINPDELMIQNVPVIPAKFRPFSAQGTTFIPGDANVLYKELIDMRNAYQQESQLFGAEGAAQTRKSMYDAVKATYGYGDPVVDKSRAKGVSGFMQKILGRGGPKYGYVSRRLLGKTQDSTGRSVIIPNPDYGMDEIGLPEDLAWKLYGPYVQRRLVRSGMAPGKALQDVADRTEHASFQLEQEMRGHPVVYSRAPVWHKFGVLSAYPKIVKGDAIELSPMVEEGLNADHDGDTVNVHLPSLPDAVEEAKTKLLPSNSLLRTRNTDSVMHTPKHEQLLGLYTAGRRSTGAKAQFATQEEALSAIRQGKLSLADEIEIPGM